MDHDSDSSGHANKACLAPVPPGTSSHPFPEHQLVNELNQLLRQDNLPYHVTDFVKDAVREVATDYPFTGREMTVIKTVAYPTVMAQQQSRLVF